MNKINLKSDFFRSITVLMSGTIAAQVIGYLVSPVITRIYTPEEMGELGLYMRIVGFLSAVVTARFELSLLLPKHEGHAFLLYKLAIRIMIITSLVMILFLFIYYLFTIDQNSDTIIFALIALSSTIMVALINLGTNWSIRNDKFKQISLQRFINSSSSNGLKVVFGYLSFGSTGLLVASLIGYILSSFTYIRDYLFLATKKYKNYSVKKIRVLGMEHKQFPFVNLPHVLTDLGRDVLVGTIIVGLYSKETFGYFSLSYTMLKLPLVVIGASIGQVLYQKCTKLVNDNTPIYPFVKKAVLLLMSLSIVPFIIIFFFGEPLFVFVFGDQWATSGEYAQIMSVWLMMNFVISPLSGLPLILNRARDSFLVSVIGSIIQILGFIIIPIFLSSGQTLTLSLYVVSISQAIYLIISVFIIMSYVKGN